MDDLRIPGTLDSREVADMIGKDHKNLLADIRTYISYLEGGELEIQPSDFFIESTYQSEQNKILPCYLVTKKGCEMIANKLTGAKGVQFTAAYVTKFNAMEQAQTARPLSHAELSLLQAQALVDLERKQHEQQAALETVTSRLDNIGDIIVLNPSAWREDAKKMIVRIAQALGGNEYIRDVQTEIYSLMLTRFSIDLSRRLSNKRARLALEGANKTQQNKLTKVDIIAEDKKAVEAYLAIIKELAIKHGVDKG